MNEACCASIWPTQPTPCCRCLATVAAMGLSKRSYQMRHLTCAAGDGRKHSATLTCIRISCSGIARFRLEVPMRDSDFLTCQVVCTLGPKSRSVPILEELLRAGMSVARFNFSHGSHDYHQVPVVLTLPAGIPALGARTPVHCTSRCCCVHLKRRLCSSGWRGSMSTTMASHWCRRHWTRCGKPWPTHASCARSCSTRRCGQQRLRSRLCM